MSLDREGLMRRYAPRLIHPTPAADAPEFYEDDEPIADVLAAFEAGQPVVTAEPEAAHTGTVRPWSPVVTTVGARTFLTAPATTASEQMWDAAPNANPHMLWMQGRFVGAEKPNRNNALWSIQDLQMGAPTVAHGPLNWLHEDRHVIGSIVDARLIPSRNEQADEGDVVREAHITALAGIWKWIYPDEAAVVEMASEAGQLAYSMECISESVQCVRNEAADVGCGEVFPYMALSNGMVCDHLKERASTRRLVNPTFLGGAVIVPPTRPGWADANASVLRQAAALAEKAFEQAGRPDIPANTWEQMMAGVLTFAGGAQ